MSLIDEEPRELIYLSLQDLVLQTACTNLRQSIDIRLGHLQIDSALPKPKFPVMLAPLLQAAPDCP